SPVGARAKRPRSVTSDWAARSTRGRPSTGSTSISRCPRPRLSSTTSASASAFDLRTDAVSRPTDEMWAAMRAAEVGWAYVGEDASVRELERLTCTLLGKEAALLLPTGSAANLVAVLALGEPGTEVLLDSTCHVATSEARGFETVAGLVERPL